MTNEVPSAAPQPSVKAPARANPVPGWVYWSLVVGLAFIVGFSAAAFLFSSTGAIGGGPAAVAAQPTATAEATAEPTIDKPATADAGVTTEPTADPRDRLYTYDEVIEMLYASVPITTPAQVGYTRYHYAEDGSPAIGAEAAPVTIVEYSDFACSYCRRFYASTLRQLLDVYGDQVRFVYRNFPILGEGSLHAAEAVMCADAQGRFWEYHDYLFNNPGTFHNLGLSAIAYQMGLDLEAFQACMDSDATLARIQTDTLAARDSGATGTPTFAINGEVLVGAQPLEVFQQLIDAKLSEGAN
ncbi:MAG: thioredoxin domain-containing protein [Anaerolineae bacterium]|nr:thioredoxin domain-containing protein [Anaerolineae bacterium]